MGYLYYGTTGYAIEVDDRPLAHLKIALLTLLRAGQSVAFSFPRSQSGQRPRNVVDLADHRHPVPLPGQPTADHQRGLGARNDRDGCFAYRPSPRSRAR